MAFMLKGLKKLFSYQKPVDPELGFELLEGSEESEDWDRYRGIKYTKEPIDEEKNKDNNKPQSNDAASNSGGDQNEVQRSQDSKEDEQNNQGRDGLMEDGQEERENQSRVQDNLYAILKKSQKKAPDSQETQWDQKKNHDQLQAVYQGLPSDNTGEKDEKHLPKEPKIIQPISIRDLVKENSHRQNKNGDFDPKKKGKGKKAVQQEQEQEKEREQEQEKEQEQEQRNSEEDSQEQNKDDGQKKEAEVEDLIWVDKSLEKNIKYMQMLFHLPLNKDIIIRKFNVGRQIPACVVFVDGMIDKDVIVQFTLPQLMDAHPFVDFKGGCPLDYIEKNVLSIHQIERMSKFEGIIPQILSGIVVVMVDGCEECLVMESRGFEKRSVGSPVTETVVHGSQEGFTENLRTNITLVRRIVKNENLITEFHTISKTNNYMTALLYLIDVVNLDLLYEVQRRIDSLKIDYISGNGMLEQLIEDKTMMLFPQVISTERPDRVASFLMEGKVVLICEGTPFALAMPITFFDLYHTSEETNLRWYYGSFLRIIRLIGILLATFLPGMYTALTLFHQEMIPSSLLASIVVSRTAVPFPTIVEILLMEFSFELIREGGIRVPGITGNTLGIIGALILGQAAVEAGLVSPILIIVVAVSGLGSFAIPNYSLSLAIRILRFLLIIFGFIGGFYGLSAGFTIICALALSMKSFGVPFFSPIAPTTRSNKDKVVRAPLSQQKQRTDFLNPQNRKRMASHPRGWGSTVKGGHSGDQGR